LLDQNFPFIFFFDLIPISFDSITFSTMAENYAPFESESNGVSHTADHGWQKVTYAKKHKKKEANGVAGSGSNKLTFNGNDAAFRSLELHSEDRRRRILEARTAADAEFDDAPVRSKQRGRNYDDDYDEDDEDADRAAENGKTEEVKKVKQKKPKKPKVTVAEAAAKIDASDLEAFLADISVECLISLMLRFNYACLGFVI
jgi:COX assembly protein 1